MQESGIRNQESGIRPQGWQGLRNQFLTSDSFYRSAGCLLGLRAWRSRLPNTLSHHR
jgi:hypothetical protein